MALPLLKIVVFFGIFLQSFGIKYATNRCNRGWTKVGCYNDRVLPDRPLPYELLNRRDKINHNNDGFFINWDDYNTTLHALACSCAELAFGRGYTYFGLQFYGECWSGPENPAYSRDGAAKIGKCTNGDKNVCYDLDDKECIGEAYTNYIYKVGDIKPILDGGWSDWSGWSPCSKSCDTGEHQRTRSCTNPPPTNGGTDCNGHSEETKECNTEKCYGVCNKKLDIALALDSSTSVSRPGWNKTLHFVLNFAKNLMIGPEKIHVGIVQFTRKPYVRIKPSDPTYWSNTAFAEKTNTIKFRYGGTRIDLAIDAVCEQFFCEECGVRDGVPKVLIVLTDGKNNVEGVLGPAADRMKKVHGRIMAVGVGPDVDQEELERIAMDKNHVYNVDDYDHILDNINTLLKDTCEMEVEEIPY